MRLFLAASTLALAALAGPIAAQPMNSAMPGDNAATPALPATPATPADPSAGMPAMPATPATPAVPADSPAAAALPPGTQTTVDNALPPPPAAAMNKSYPVCTRTMQDNCQNPGEGGAPGRTRATTHKRHHRG